jgi:hypothetical protein
VSKNKNNLLPTQDKLQVKPNQGTKLDNKIFIPYFFAPPPIWRTFAARKKIAIRVGFQSKNVFCPLLAAK